MLQWRAVCNSSSSSSVALSDAAPWPHIELQRLAALVDLFGCRFEPIAVLMPGRSAQQCEATYSAATSAAATTTAATITAAATAGAAATSAGEEFSCMSTD
jgi:hypothetical protein